MPVILPESDIYCLEIHCQIRWTITESDRALQEIRWNIFYFKGKLIWGTPFNWGSGHFPRLPCGKQVPGDTVSYVSSSIAVKSYRNGREKLVFNCLEAKNRIKRTHHIGF